jgi:hypothetical protein
MSPPYIDDGPLGPHASIGDGQPGRIPLHGNRGGPGPVAQFMLL